GTAYQESFGASESPTCGYTYSQPSPEGGYTITATSHWSIEWDGGGQSGTFTTDFTATTGYQVGELQALRGASEQQPDLGLRCCCGCPVDVAIGVDRSRRAGRLGMASSYSRLITISDIRYSIGRVSRWPARIASARAAKP